MKIDQFSVFPFLETNGQEVVCQRIKNLKGVFSVRSDAAGSQLTIVHSATLSRKALAGELFRLGYSAPGEKQPKTGTAQ
jgi:hypothetical protein